MAFYFLLSCWDHYVKWFCRFGPRKGGYTKKRFEKELFEEQMNLLDHMEIPPGIAKNQALRENVFVTLTCILQKIPLFVVGKPGSGKTLSLQLIFRFSMDYGQAFIFAINCIISKNEFVMFTIVATCGQRISAFLRMSNMIFQNFQSVRIILRIVLGITCKNTDENYGYLFGVVTLVISHLFIMCQYHPVPFFVKAV